MADRRRSHDGTRETDRFRDDAPAPSGQGRTGEGHPARDVGTRDELRRARKGETGVTRVTKEDEAGEGNLGGHHGTGRDG